MTQEEFQLKILDYTKKKTPNEYDLLLLKDNIHYNSWIICKEILQYHFQSQYKWNFKDYLAFELVDQLGESRMIRINYVTDFIDYTTLINNCLKNIYNRLEFRSSTWIAYDELKSYVINIE